MRASYPSKPIYRFIVKRWLLIREPIYCSILEDKVYENKSECLSKVLSYMEFFKKSALYHIFKQQDSEAIAIYTTESLTPNGISKAYYKVMWGLI